jgi:hypothetical protein
LIFLTLGPLLVGLVGFGSKSVVRPLLGALVMATVAVVWVATGSGSQTMGDANQTFIEWAQDTTGAASEGAGHSGVVFNDGGSPFGALGPKIIYTLLSPFPWQTGSIGLHLAKIDVVLWYYFAYRAWLAARRIWKESPSLVFMFLSFLGPTTFLYATIMTNIGLIVRERLPIVTVSVLLALLSWPAKPTEEEKDQETADATDGAGELGGPSESMV